MPFKVGFLIVPGPRIGAGVSTFPWQFAPETYGALGNGKVVGDVVTNSTTVITSATAGWTAADTGKTIMINGANGTAAAPLITTIASVQSATQVTLAAAAGISTSGCAAVWGTDDTAAFNSAFAAALAYATANGYRAQVICQDRIYMLAAAPTQSTGPTYNTQVKIPFSDLTGASRKVMIDFLGVGHQGTNQFFQSTIPNLAGTCLVSTQTAPSTPDPTFGVQSVVGGPSGGGSFTAGFADTHIHVDGIEIFCPVYTNLKAWNFGFLAGATWGSFAANIFAPAVQGTHPVLNDLPSQVGFQSSKGVGCTFPFNGNNDDVAGVRFAAQGYEAPVSIQDHFSCLNLVTLYADVCALYDSGQGLSGSSNLVYIGNWSAEAYNGGFLANGGYVTLDARMTTETPGGVDPSYDVKDQGSNIHGSIWVGDNNGRTNRRPVIVNCANLKVVNNMLGPGHWASPPAVPASGTAQQNTAWRDATVVVHAGAGVTVSAIAVDGTATSQTVAASSSSVPIRVPSGKTITLTYAGGTPTWDWWLD